MSNDTFTEVTTQGWFSRIGSSIKGILFGVLLFLAAFVVLWWNEGRAVKTAKSLNEGEKLVVPLASPEALPANDGKLVHTTGEAKSMDTLTDPEFAVSLQAISLERYAEMYQWDESSSTTTEKKTGGKEVKTTTYSYDKVWSSSRIDSASFKKPEGHQNPASMPYSSETWNAANVRLGEFSLTPAQIGKIGGNVAVDPELIQIPASLKGKAQMTGGTVYIGKSPDTPEIGDMRISFTYVPDQTVSIVAQQTGATFQPYQTKAGRALSFLKTGSKSAEEMFAAERKMNAIILWAVRVGGFILMMIGLNMMMAPLAVFADVVPFIGGIVRTGTGIIAFLIAVFFSLVTIALAWVFFRPLIGVPLLVLAVVAAVLAIQRILKNKGETAPTPAA